VDLLSSADAAEESFTFVQLCDTQLGMGGYEHDLEMFRLAVRQINALRPDFVLICGDLVNEAGSDSAIRDFLAVRSILSMPCYCTPGNHDVGNDAAENLMQTYLERIGEDRACATHHGYAFVGVNTQIWKCPPGEASARQDEWLKRTLESAHRDGHPIVVYGHIPLFLDTPDEGEEYFNLAPAKRHELFALFKANGVRAYLAGHTHKNIVREHEGILYVASATTSKNFDAAPMGFRVWHVAADQLDHEYVAVEGATPPAE